MVVVALGLSWPSAAWAGASDPDTTFGTNGAVLTPFPVTGTYRAVAPLSDGRLIVAGSASGWIVQRLTPTGQVDSSFGNSGVAAADTVAYGNSFANAVALQPDGKIVIAGTTNVRGASATRLFVTRLTADGAVDTGFAGNGTYTLPNVSGLDMAAVGTGVAVEPNGDIFAVGSVVEGAANGGDPPTSLLAVQLSKDGTPDASFHSAPGDPAATVNGVSVGPAGSSTVETLSAVALDHEGRPAAVGDQSDHTLPLVVRYLTTGTGAGGLDTAFGGGGTGRVTPVYASNNSDPNYVQNPVASAVQVDGSDRILVLSSGKTFSRTDPNQATRFVIDRLNTDGTADTSFGGDSQGRDRGSITDYPTAAGADTIDGLGLDSGGLIYVGGSATVDQAEKFLLSRFTAAGQPDASFTGTSSHPETTTFAAGDGGQSLPYGLAITATDRAVLVGSSKTSGGSFDASAVRFGGAAAYPVPDPKVDYTPVHAGAPIRPGQQVTLDGSGTTDPNPKGFDSYVWDTNDDGTFDTGGVNVVIHPQSSGTAVLKVTNSDGLTATKAVNYTVAANRPPVIGDISIVSSGPVVAGKPVTFQAATSDDGSVVSYAWVFGSDASPSKPPISSSNQVTTTFENGGAETFTVTVTDDEGATATITRSIPVALPPCEGSDGLHIGHVTLLALVPHGKTCLHVSTVTDNKTGVTTTSASATAGITVNGITVTPDNAQPADQIQAVFKQKGGKVTSATLTAPHATVSGFAKNAPTTFDHGKVSWNLAGNSIGGFVLMKGATLGGMALTLHGAPSLNADGATSTLDMIPALPKNFSPMAQTPNQPIKVTFGKGQITDGQAPVGMEAAQDYPTIIAHSAGDAHPVPNPCSSKPGNGGFDFCVQNIPLGVATVQFLHVYYDPSISPDTAAWGAEAAVTVNVGEEGPFDIAAGLEFFQDKASGKTSFHAAYAALGAPNQTVLDVGVLQLHYIAFQITIARPGHPEDFLESDLHPADVAALQDIEGGTGGGGSNGPNGTCVPHVGWEDLYYGVSEGSGKQPDLSKITDAVKKHPTGPGAELRTFLNNAETVEPGHVGLGDYIAAHYKHSIVSAPNPSDYGTPDLALCGGIGLNLFEVIGLDVKFGYAEYPPQHTFPQETTVFWIDGKVTLEDIITADVYGQFWSDGFFDFGMRVNVDLGSALHIDGGADVEEWHKLYNADGYANVDIKPLGFEAGAEVLFSNRGMAGCLKMSFFGNDWSPGFGKYWGHDPHFYMDSCNVGPYKQVIDHPKVASDRVQWRSLALATAATVPGEKSFVVPAGAPGFTLALTGATAPPHVMVVSPSGKTFDTGADNSPLLNAMGLAVHNPAAKVTEVAIHGPQAGRWNIVPASDSSAITGEQFGLGQRNVTGTAGVAGKGMRRTLHYRLNNLAAGDQVRLVEAGRGGSIIGQLARVHASAAAVNGVQRSGTMKFTPSPGVQGPRMLRALVFGPDGLPRQSIDLGSYMAPPAPAPAPVTAIRLVRHKGSLTLSWKQPHGQINPAHYIVVVQLSDGRVIGFAPTGRSVVIPDVAAGTHVRALIRPVSRISTFAPERSASLLLKH